MSRVRRPAPSAADAPVGEAEFAALIGRFGPFESQPVIAVGVSGGADSSALAVLAARWARRRGGRAVALTVDHGLRPGSRAEARTVAARLGALGIEHRLLAWRGAKPRSGIQQVARDARYRLLGGWCRANGVLHLLLAHHREDQAETVLQRLGQASGPDGLAGMASVAERADLRLLRPCLDLPRARLRATARAHGLDWVEDPSNLDPAFARVRLRSLAPALAEEGLDAAALCASARRLAAARAALEADCAQLLARHAVIHPQGYAELALAPLAAVPPEIARRALERLLVAVGGRDYPPRGARLVRLAESLTGAESWRGRTLAGCRLDPRGEKIVIAREASRCERRLVSAGETLHWDGRFRIRVNAAGRGLGIAALGGALPRKAREPWLSDLPGPVRAALPALWRGKSLVAVPCPAGAVPRPRTTPKAPLEAVFSPSRPATGASFPVV